MALAARLWDALFWITVVFPLLTGGIWISRPGLKIELAQISIPLAVLSLGAAFLLWRGRPAFENLSSVRFLFKIWSWWEKRITRSPKATLLYSTLFFGFFWSWVALERHWAFNSGYADLGIFMSAIWNLSHGNGYVSSLKNGINLFSDHQSPIFWLLAPVYKLFPRAETLLIAQGFGLCAGAPALYLIGKQYIRDKSPYLAALPLLYWVFNPLRNANRFDFHPEIFLLPAFLYGIWGLQEKSWGKRLVGCGFILLALMGKESAGPVLAGVGAAWILGAAPAETRRFCRLIGLPLVLVGIAHLYFCTKIVPTFFEGRYQYQNMYAQFGEGLSSLFFAPFTQPKLFLSHLFGLERIRFLLGTLAPVSFLPLLSPSAFVAALPGYLIYFLSAGSHRLSLGYHYAIESSVGVLWALAVTFSKLNNPFFWPKLPRWPLAYLIFSLAFICYGRSELYFIRYFNPPEHHQWAEKDVFPSLPVDASLMTTGYFVPHLANRPWIHHLPVLEIPGRGFVDCVVWSRHPTVNNSPMSDTLNAELTEKMNANGFRAIWTCDSLTVYQNPAYQGQCLSPIPPCNR